MLITFVALAFTKLANYRNLLYNIFVNFSIGQNNDCSTLFDGVVEGDFGPAFAGGGSVGFVVIDDAVLAVVYHLIIALDFDAHLHQYKVRKNGVRQKKALANTKAFTVGYQILD